MDRYFSSTGALELFRIRDHISLDILDHVELFGHLCLHLERELVLDLFEGVCASAVSARGQLCSAIPTRCILSGVFTSCVVVLVRALDRDGLDTRHVGSLTGEHSQILQIIVRIERGFTCRFKVNHLRALALIIEHEES